MAKFYDPNFFKTGIILIDYYSTKLKYNYDISVSKKKNKINETGDSSERHIYKNF